MQYLLSKISQRQLLVFGTLFLALFISAITVAITWHNLPYLSDDSEHYIELAEGRAENVIKPYSNRIFHPLMVQTLATIGNISTDQSFFVWAIVALIILTLAVSMIIRLVDLPNPLIIIIAVLLTPFLLNLFKDYYLPDLFHAALLGLFFLLIACAQQVRQQCRWAIGASFLVLFLLVVTRESTILLTLSIVLISFYKSERKLAYAAIAATLVGIFAVSLAAHPGQTNIHAMNDLVYMGLKIPHNFLKNILGIQLWANTFAANQATYCAPIMTMNLPNWLHLSSINSIGMCDFEPLLPLKTMTLLLVTFGIAPTLVIYDLVKNFKKILIDSPLWLLIALTYGLLAFFLGTSIGASVMRLIAYGWPCFLIVAPIFLLKYHHLNRKSSYILLLCHVFVSWIAWLVNGWKFDSVQSTLPILFSALILHYFAFQTLRKTSILSER